MLKTNTGKGKLEYGIGNLIDIDEVDLCTHVGGCIHAVSEQELLEVWNKMAVLDGRPLCINHESNAHQLAHQSRKEVNQHHASFDAVPAPPVALN